MLSVPAPPSRRAAPDGGAWASWPWCCPRWPRCAASLAGEAHPRRCARPPTGGRRGARRGACPGHRRALLHDIGKATTLAGGHFIGHERVGADLAARVLQRLRFPGPPRSRPSSTRSGEHVRLRARCGAATPRYAASCAASARIGSSCCSPCAGRGQPRVGRGRGGGRGGRGARRTRIRRVGRRIPPSSLVTCNDLARRLASAPCGSSPRCWNASSDPHPALNCGATLLALARSLAAEARSPAE